MNNRFVVIMAGGRGERFWPQSRLKRPKHLLPIVGDTPMLAQTIDRLEGLVPVGNIFVITNREQREAVLECCPGLKPEHVIGEPMGRDTAAAVGLATLLVQRLEPDAAFAMLPADAVIHDSAGFRNVLGDAFRAAEESDSLVTIGIKPTHPATGYGYVHKAEQQQVAGSRPIYRVEKFVEKPDLDTAQAYLDSGEYFWNAGMFIWRASVIAAALEKLTPGLWQALQGIREGLDAGGALDGLLDKHYPELEKISVDYAVMEKADNVAMVESAFDWDDVGEWPAIARHYEPDEEGNVVRGNALVEHGSNNIVINEDGHLTALIGVDDLIVVQTKDATLICPKGRAQEIKTLVQKVTNDPDKEHLV